MGVLRARLLRRIRARTRTAASASTTRRCRGSATRAINVHAKLMIVDDRFVRIGSANLNNRSMGLDSECDLAVEDAGDGRCGRPRRFLARLLAEHLGVEARPVRRGARAQPARRARPSRRCAAAPRTLEPLDGTVAPWLESVVPEAAVVDPERADRRRRSCRRWWRRSRAAAPRQWPLLALGAFALAGGRRVALDPAALLVRPGRARCACCPPLGAQPVGAGRRRAGSFVAGGLLLVPVTLLIVVTAAAFGPRLGRALRAARRAAQRGAGYGLGRALGRQRVRRLFGSRLSSGGQRLSRHGIVVVTVIRLLPLAPYSIVNLAAGAAEIGLRDFLIGTALGMLPGVFGAALFAEQLVRTMRRPEPGNVLLLIARGDGAAAGGALDRASLDGPSAPGGGLAARLAARFRTSGRTPGTAAPSPRRLKPTSPGLRVAPPS